MRTCTLIFTLCLFSTLQVNGQKTVDQKIEDDILVIDDMLDDLEGYKMVDSLKKIVEEYRVYWNTTIGPPSEDDLKDFYVTIGEKLLEFAPVYDADFKSDLIDLKNSYEDIEPSPKELKKLRKNFKNFKKAHEKNKPNNIDKIKIANLIRQYEKAGGRRDISIGDILREGGQLILVLDDYADRFGKLDNLSDAEMDSLKANPIKFISEKTDKHIEKYRRLKDSLSVVEIQTDLLQDYQTIISELNDSIERENKKFSQENTTLLSVKKSVENELLVSTNRQNQLNQELTQIRSRLSKYEQDLQAKIDERDALSEDMEELRAMLTSKTNEFAITHKESVELQAIASQLRADTAKLQEAKAKIEKEKQTLFDEKESAENGRLIFLISSIVLLLGLLSYVLYGQWLVRKENQALSEEKVLLEKNIEYTEGFYDEYRKTTKAEIAIQREELKKNKEQLEGNTKKLEKRAKQNDVMLRELNHRTKNNLQLISSIIGVWALKIKDEQQRDDCQNIQRRIHAIGLIHKGMYKKVFDEEVEIDMQQYIACLTDNLKKAFQINAVKIRKQVGSISIRPDKAIPIGLITNEVITNAFKYAFVDHANPELDIKFGYNNKNKDKIHLKIKDNGKVSVPIYNGKLKCPRDDSFGTLLVKLLTKELEGTCYYDKTAEGGLKFILIIPTKNLKHTQPISSTIINTSL